MRVIPWLHLAKKMSGKLCVSHCLLPLQSSLSLHSLLFNRLIGTIRFPASIQFLLLCSFSSAPHDIPVYLHEFGQTRHAAVAPLLCAGCPYANYGHRRIFSTTASIGPIVHFDWMGLRVSIFIPFRASLVVVPFSDCLRFSKFGLSLLLRVHFPLAIFISRSIRCYVHVHSQPKTLASDLLPTTFKHSYLPPPTELLSLIGREHGLLMIHGCRSN